MSVDEIMCEINRWRANKKVSIFVGAGVSMVSNLPSWSGLVRSMSDELGYTKLDEDKKFDSQELLKIPQLFYIQYGEKKYIEKVTSNFSGNYLPNSIHDLIFALQPRHLLTTNYDTLLEQEAVKIGKNYSVINSDRIVSKAESSSYIIKLHGDFSTDFVLKEQDYLDYDLNYMLLDKLVKTVFATNLVIFIGYGLNDYNIKLILNWVKNVQADTFIHPIFIHTDDPLNDLELKYQQERGLRVLQCNDFGVIPESYEDRYALVLQSILNYDDRNHLETPAEKFTFIENQVSGIINLHYLRSKDVNSIFTGDYSIGENLVLNNISPTIRITEDRRQTHEIDYFETLYDTLSANSDAIIPNGIQKFLSAAEFENKRHSFGKNDVITFSNAAYGVKINELIKYCQIEYKSEEELFMKAYYLGILGQYEKSYNIFTALIPQLQQKKKWDLFYFGQINRKYLEWCINHSYRFNLRLRKKSLFSEGFLSRLKIEMEPFQLNKQFSQLPVIFQNKYSSLAEFSNENPYVEENTELIKEMNKAIQDRVRGTVYLGGMPKAETIKRKMYEEVKFVYENGLLISLFNEFKNYVKTALLVWLESYSHNLNSPSDDEDFSPHNNIYYSFTLNDIILMSESFSNADFEYLIKAVDLKKIPFEEEEKLTVYLNAQIKDYTEMFAINNINVKNDNRILFEQQSKRLNLLLKLSSYFVKDNQNVQNLLMQIRNVRSIYLPLHEIRIVIVRWVNLSKVNRQTATDIIVNWLIDCLHDNEFAKAHLSREDINCFVDMIKRVGNDEVKISRITKALVSKLDFEVIKCFTPLFSMLNKEMQVYLMQNVSVESIVDLKKCFGEKIPDGFDILPIIHHTFNTLLERDEENGPGIYSSYMYSSEGLLRTTIILMLQNNITLDEYIGKYDEYDFWFNFDCFEPEKFNVEWLQYYPDDILNVIKTDAKKRVFVLDVMEKNVIGRTKDVREIERYYYVYCFLSKQ